MCFFILFYHLYIDVLPDAQMRSLIGKVPFRLRREVHGTNLNRFGECI